jgi:predicted nucleotidyltransferase
MIKKTPIKHDILKLIPEAEIYLGSRRDVLFSYLFGSFAKNLDGPFSDVDIAVYLKGHDL